MVKSSPSESQLSFLHVWWLSGDSLLPSGALPRAQISLLPSVLPFPASSLPTFSSSPLPLFSHTFPSVWTAPSLLPFLINQRSGPLPLVLCPFSDLSPPPFLDFWILDLLTFRHPYHHISDPFSLEPVLRVPFVAFTSHPSPLLTPPIDSKSVFLLYYLRSLSREHLLSTITNIQQTLDHPWQLEPTSNIICGTMVQPHEAFHPSSPPSEGGADSYNHEGTPDTRLTAFSPLEESSKSSRLFSALSLSDGNDRGQSIEFQSPPGTHHVASPTSFGTGARDRDPFVSSPPEKRQTKLSATASTFKPLSTPVVPTPVVAYSSTSVTPKPFGRAVATGTVCPKTGLMLAPGLSHNMGLTRSLRVSSPDGVTADAVKQYIEVSTM